MKIPLSSILLISNPKQYKAHLACWDGHNQPLDVFVRDRGEWHLWNAWRSKRDEFNRQYIFALIDFYPEPETWLFGGVYQVISRGGENSSHSYEVELQDEAAGFIGRLKVKLKRPGRVKAVRLERYFPLMVVSELLKEPYSGEAFCGYENIKHDFNQLETVFKANRSDWKAALENVKGVYLVFDKSNGKKYVGAAYGSSGIWARWVCYIKSGHGALSNELTALIKSEGIEYARENFRFSLLEYHSMTTDDSVVIDRENYWKEALASRGKHGYNRR